MGGAAEQTAPAAWRGYARGRARALVAGAALAVLGTCAGPSVPEKTESSVATLLGEAIGGEVDPRDFVWERSRGFWNDAFIGRRVLFLGRKGPPGTPRALYRAGVTVTRGGRPLRVRVVAQLGRTDLADEDGLLVDGDHAAVAALAQGRAQSVEWLDLGSKPAPMGFRARLRDTAWGGVETAVEARRVSFERPPREARYEFQGGDLVLAYEDVGRATLDGSGELMVREDDPSGAFVTRAAHVSPNCRYSPEWTWLRSHLRHETPAPPKLDRSVSFFATEPANIDYAFPPSDAFTKVEDKPGVYRREVKVGGANVVLTAFDMRFLSARLVVGSDFPMTRTGHVSSGVDPELSTAVAAISIPPALDGGAWDHGIVVAPLAPTPFTLFEADGALSTGEGSAVPAPRGTAIQWADRQGSASEARAALCITAAGHLVHAWSPSATPDDLLASLKDQQCVAISPAAPADAVATSVDPTIEKTGALYFLEAPAKPPVDAPAASKWAILEAIQPEPKSIPAAYEASIEKLGAPVRIRLFMPHRFEWTIRAGEQEKQHRFGGHFEQELTEADKARAFFAVSLGIGKRHSPNGLRIAGSTGHAFHTHLGLLESTNDGLRLASSASAEPEGDATELPLTVEARALTTEARIRGPKQPRADICVLPDGTVLLADAEFDNHEATASALADIGCTLAAALDRGADRPNDSEDRTSPNLTNPHPTTQLYALGHPFRGTATTLHP